MPSFVHPRIKMAMLFPKAPGRCDVCPHILQQSGSGERLSDVLAAEQPSTAPREHADRRGSVLSNYIVEPRYTPMLAQKKKREKKKDYTLLFIADHLLFGVLLSTGA